MDKVSCVVSFLLAFLLSLHPGVDGGIGINYGRSGNNLPSVMRTISKLHEINMTNIRLFLPHEDALTALHRSGISVIVGARVEDLGSLPAAQKWVKTHIVPHRSYVKFKCIAVGNDVLSKKIPKAMRRLHSALAAANISIPVSTAVSTKVLTTSYPPSAAAFSDQSRRLMTEITRFLKSKKFPLLVNVFPYFARVRHPEHIDLDFALFKPGRIARDGTFTYRNMFDAMIDSVHVAMNKVGGSGARIIVSETGWPTHGGVDASVKNAGTYVNNLIRHVSTRRGTPRMRGREIEAYVYSMFNENLKPRGGVGRYWGLYYPNLTEVYNVTWPATKTKENNHTVHPPVSGVVGINYGLIGDNLPTPSQSISRLQEMKVGSIRIFQPDNGVLTALHRSGISVIVGSYNEDLKSLASDESTAAAWVNTNILPHHSTVNISCISLGNEVYPGELAQYIPAAMKNIDAALVAAKLSIPVSTTVSMQVLSTSYPPSSGDFSDQAKPVMTQIAQFLESKNYPLLVNVYPYFARVGDPSNVRLEFALFKDQAPAAPVKDGENSYLNLFDAMTDSVYAALEKVGAPNVEVIVSETGWPTAGGNDASVENARTYVNNLIAHVSSGKGTPRRPGRKIKTYIFAMYNENHKAAGVEQNWGLLYPNMTEVYHVDHF